MRIKNFTRDQKVYEGTCVYVRDVRPKCFVGVESFDIHLRTLSLSAGVTGFARKRHVFNHVVPVGVHMVHRGVAPGNHNRPAVRTLSGWKSVEVSEKKALEVCFGQYTNPACPFLSGVYRTKPRLDGMPSAKLSLVTIDPSFSLPYGLLVGFQVFLPVIQSPLSHGAGTAPVVGLNFPSFSTGGALS